MSYITRHICDVCGNDITCSEIFNDCHVRYVITGLSNEIISDTEIEVCERCVYDFKSFVLKKKASESIAS